MNQMQREVPEDGCAPSIHYLEEQIDGGSIDSTNARGNRSNEAGLSGITVPDTGVFKNLALCMEILD